MLYEWITSSNLTLCTIMHCLNNNNNPFRWTYNMHRLPQNLTWYSIESLLKINESKIKVFIFAQKFFLKLSDNEHSVSCPTSRHETKLRIINDYTTFPEYFCNSDDSFHYFQCLICEFQTTVIPSVYCTTFTLKQTPI